MVPVDINLAKNVPTFQDVYGSGKGVPVRSYSSESCVGAARLDHLLEQVVQKAVVLAAKRAGIAKPSKPHVLHHSHMLRSDHDIHTVQ